MNADAGQTETPSSPQWLGARSELMWDYDEDSVILHEVTYFTPTYEECLRLLDLAGNYPDQTLSR